MQVRAPIPRPSPAGPRFERLERRRLMAASLVTDLYPTTGFANVTQAIDLGHTALFGHSGKLYKTDGTAAGTVPIADVSPSPMLVGVADRVPEYAVLGDVAVFATPGGAPSQYHVYRSDGTPQGTYRLREISLNLAGTSADLRTGPFIKWNGAIYFAATDAQHGAELWKTDGTDAGTVLVRDVTPGPGSTFQMLTIMSSLGVGADAIYFNRRFPDGQSELWRSDGTQVGTTLVRSLGPKSSFEQGSGDFFPAGNRTLFSVNNPTVGVSQSLWTTDGTPAGTAEFSPSGATSAPIFQFNGLAYFRASTPLWTFYRSDGTPAGTSALDLPHPRHRSKVAVVGDEFYYTASSPAGSDSELLRSDGTPAGTHFIAGPQPGPRPYAIDDPVAWRGAVYFTAEDGVHGREVWRSDGTPGGTVLVADLRTGQAGSAPGPLTVAGDQLYFTADSTEFGRELFKVIDDVPPRPTRAAPSQRHPAEFQIRFGEPVRGLEASDFVLASAPSLPGPPAWNVTLAFDPTTATYTVAPQGALPDGNYRFTLPADALTDSAGNPLPADVVLDFHVLSGDANGDRSVNFQDVVILAQNYGQTNTTWRQADFTGDARTDFQDLVVLAQRYNTAVPPPTAPAAVVKKEATAPVFNAAAPLRTAPPRKSPPRSRKA